MLWFQHESVASHDPKLRRLRRRYGLEGLARWWLLVEYNAHEGKWDGEFFSVEMTKSVIEDLSKELELAPRALRKFIALAADEQLLDKSKYSAGILAAHGLPSRADNYTKDRLGITGKELKTQAETEKSLPSNREETSKRLRKGTFEASIYIDPSSNKEQKKNGKERQEGATNLVGEITAAWRQRHRRKMKWFAGYQGGLEQLIRNWDAATVLKAWREFLQDSNKWLVENRHPFGAFAKQFEHYVVDDVPAEVKPTAAAPPLAEIEADETKQRARVEKRLEEIRRRKQEEAELEVQNEGKGFK